LQPINRKKLQVVSQIKDLTEKNEDAQIGLNEWFEDLLNEYLHVKDETTLQVKDRID